MNDKAWYFFCVLLFFSILIPTTVFLLYRDNSKTFSSRLTTAVMESVYGDHVYPMQTLDLNNPDDCMENLLNKLQSGNSDLKTLRDNLDSLEKCFGLNLDDNAGNNTPVVPQPPIADSPQFV